MSAQNGALEAIGRVLNRGGDADDVLRAVVSILHERLGQFVRISFAEEGSLVPGPAAGEETTVTSYPIEWAGRRVAELEVGGDADAEERALLEHVAVLVAAHALVGWDTGGEAWTP